jgi:hypothetical protein
MANVRKLIARLNPASIRYGVGRGGIPELTPQDIAGALGMVPNGLGREIFCHLWWPDGARLTQAQLLDYLVRAQFEEWSRRADILRAAQIAHYLADDPGRAKAQLQAAKDQMWPGIAGHTIYRLIRLAVLLEMAAPSLCQSCGGRGEVKQVSLMVQCDECHGEGRRGRSDRQRAASINRDISNYVRTWRGPYEWLYAHCRDAEDKAVHQFEAALGVDSAAA